MRITYDPNKRARTLAARGLDFEAAVEVFAGPTTETLDTRKAYGEQRILCYGYLRGRLVMVGYTARGETRHVFSMRKANEREKRQFTPRLRF
jgi:uncharacterized DUF497 family protein